MGLIVNELLLSPESLLELGLGPVLGLSLMCYKWYNLPRLVALKRLKLFVIK